MRRGHGYVTTLLLFSLFVMLSTSGEYSSSATDLLKFLPSTVEAGEWERDDSPQEYRGDSLYEYINGGAEIYHDYGFKQVVVQDFKNKSGKSISIEIFEMEDSESAFGIYTFKTSPEERKLALGSDARLSDYYLNFWKGNLLVTITGFDEDEETIEGLQELARAVDAKIKRKGERPHLVSALPEEGLFPTSIKYFQGNLGLYNSYPFFTKDVFYLKEAVKADYKGGYTVYIINSKETADAQDKFDDVVRSFEQSPKYTNLKQLEESLFQVEDSKGKRMFVSVYENSLFIVMGAVHPSQAKNIFSSIQNNIGK
ncbi:MAG: hypothetical protein JSV46_06175 [Candidatus Aminicenantes bacterium]|nr:MAG: hypothetical protein JSV46_06175 [Candidatus Aminicenantes bacterium]